MYVAALPTGRTSPQRPSLSGLMNTRVSLPGQEGRDPAGKPAGERVGVGGRMEGWWAIVGGFAFVQGCSRAKAWKRLVPGLSIIVIQNPISSNAIHNPASSKG